MRLLSRPKGRCCVMVRGCRRAIRALLLYLHHSYHVGFERLARIDGKLRGTGCFSLIPASPDTDTSPVLGPRRRPRAPMRAKPQCVDSRGRGCARPASEGAADVSTSKAIGMTGESRQQVTQHGDQGEVGGRHRIVIKAVRQDPSQSLPFPANDDSLPNSADIEWHQ